MRVADPVNMIYDLEIGRPWTAPDLTVVPVSGNRPSSLEYLLADEAILTEKVDVEEVSDQGSVSELRMVNFSNRFILVVDGMMLNGGKKNRIVNASFLIPPESITEIPVSCVEQGRWQYNRREFKNGRCLSPHSIRRENAALQKTALGHKRGYVSDQRNVWAYVASMSETLGVPTATGSMNEILEKKKSSLERYGEGMVPNDFETGAAFFVHGIFRGIELFDRAATFRKMFPKLLSGIAVDMMMARGERFPGQRGMGAEEPAECLRSILEEVGYSAFEKYEPVGVGDDWRYDANRSFGKALRYGADLIHFSAFGK